MVGALNFWRTKIFPKNLAMSHGEVEAEVVEKLLEPANSKVLATGGTGVIYLGYVAQKLVDGGDFGSFVAVKKLSPKLLRPNVNWSGGRFPVQMSAVDKFRNQMAAEIKLMSDVRHHNVARFLGYATAKWSNSAPDVFYICEYASRGSLGRALESDSTAKEMTWFVRARIAYQFLSAVKYLHRKGYLHRDIKSDNIALTEGFIPKLIDFGMSRATFANQTGESYTTFSIGHDGIGTRGYVCPGFNNGTAPSYDTFCEMFSVGIVLAELLCGRLQNSAEGKAKVLSEEVKNMEDDADADMNHGESGSNSDDDNDGDDGDVASGWFGDDGSVSTPGLSLAEVVDSIEPDARVSLYEDVREEIRSSIVSTIRGVARILLSEYRLRKTLLSDKKNDPFGKEVSKLRKILFNRALIKEESTTLGDSNSCCVCLCGLSSGSLKCVENHSMCNVCAVSAFEDQAQIPSTKLTMGLQHGSLGERSVFSPIDNSSRFACPICFLLDNKRVFYPLDQCLLYQAKMRQLAEMQGRLLHNFERPQREQTALFDNVQSEEEDRISKSNLPEMLTFPEYEHVQQACKCSIAIGIDPPLVGLRALEAAHKGTVPWRCIALKPLGKTVNFGVFHRSKEPVLYVAFQGYEDDVVVLKSCLLNPQDSSAGMVSRGCLMKAQEVVFRMFDFIKGTVERLGMKTVVFCGYSRGGAIAQLVAYLFAKEWLLMEQTSSTSAGNSGHHCWPPMATHSRSYQVHVRCITFGAALIGDRDFCRTVRLDPLVGRLKYQSFAHCNDKVNQLISNACPIGTIVYFSQEDILITEDTEIATRIVADLNSTQSNEVRALKYLERLKVITPEVNLGQLIRQIREPSFTNIGHQGNLKDGGSLHQWMGVSHRFFASPTELELFFGVEHGTLGILPVTEDTNFISICFLINTAMDAAVLPIAQSIASPMPSAERVMGFLHALFEENDLIPRMVEVGDPRFSNKLFNAFVERKVDPEIENGEPNRTLRGPLEFPPADPIVEQAVLREPATKGRLFADVFAQGSFRLVAMRPTLSMTNNKPSPLLASKPLHESSLFIGVYLSKEELRKEFHHQFVVAYGDLRHTVWGGKQPDSKIVGHVNSMIWHVAVKAVQEILTREWIWSVREHVVLTGYSLCGAVAQIVAYQLAVQLPAIRFHVVTFGAPFIADVAFHTHCREDVRNLHLHNVLYDGVPAVNVFSVQYLRSGMYAPLGPQSVLFRDGKLITCHTLQRHPELLVRLLYHGFGCAQLGPQVAQPFSCLKSPATATPGSSASTTPRTPLSDTSPTPAKAPASSKALPVKLTAKPAPVSFINQTATVLPAAASALSEDSQAKLTQPVYCPAPPELDESRFSSTFVLTLRPTSQKPTPDVAINQRASVSVAADVEEETMEVRPRQSFSEAFAQSFRNNQMFSLERGQSMNRARSTMFQDQTMLRLQFPLLDINMFSWTRIGRSTEPARGYATAAAHEDLSSTSTNEDDSVINSGGDFVEYRDGGLFDGVNSFQYLPLYCIVGFRQPDESAMLCQWQVANSSAFAESIATVSSIRPLPLVTTYHTGPFGLCRIPGLALPDQANNGIYHPVWHCCGRREKVGCQRGFPRHHSGEYTTDQDEPYDFQGFRDPSGPRFAPKWSCCGSAAQGGGGCRPGIHPHHRHTYLTTSFKAVDPNVG